MLKNSRVSSTLDVVRLGQALARPGMDTRTWVSLAIVDKVVIDPDEGVFADVTLMPTNVQTTVRVGTEYAGDGFGLYMPVMVDDEVLVEAPNGNPDNGLVLTRRLHSKSDPPPGEAVENPDDVLLVVRKDKTMRILVEGDGLVEIRSRGGTSRALAFKDELVAVDNRLTAVDNKYAAHLHVSGGPGFPTGGPVSVIPPNPSPPPIYPSPIPPIPLPGVGPVDIVGTIILKAE